MEPQRFGAVAPLEALEGGRIAEPDTGDTEDTGEDKEELLPAATPPLVLVLVGRVGVGKSSTANCLCRPTVPLAAKRAASAVTSACQTLEATINGHDVLVIDTPGLGDAAKTEAEIFEEIRNSLKVLVPEGARVCLVLVLSFQARVGEAEMEMNQGFEDRLFGRNYLHQALVVWTHADLLDGTGPDEYLADADPSFMRMLSTARGGQIYVANRLGQTDTEATYDSIVKQALTCAEARIPYATKRFGGGRKAARRQRQIEAGLISEERIMRHRQPQNVATVGEDPSRCTVS